MIEVKEVSKHFGNIKAIDKVSFRIERGEVVGFLGPNGAGKTTIMRMITGFLEPTSGKIIVDNQDSVLNNLEIKQQLGYLAENNPLYENMLVCEYLKTIAALKGFSKRNHEVIDQVVKDTGIENIYYRPINELSKGFRQRVGLAQAIFGHPEILILDEPTEGLDPNQRVDIRSLITSLGKQKTVMLSTHIISEATAMCDRVLILDKGKIVADGKVEELLKGTDKKQRIHLDVETEKDIRNDILNIEGIVDIVSTTNLNSRFQYIILADASKNVPPLLFKAAKENNWVLWGLHQEKANLENIFRNLTRQE